MSLFQCDNCGCVENTALASQGFTGIFEKLYDWGYAPERRGMRLCSACGPVKCRNGSATEYGKWHNVFTRDYLPIGEFETNDVGNLVHKKTKSEDYRQYIIRSDKYIPNTGFDL